MCRRICDGIFIAVAKITILAMLKLKADCFIRKKINNRTYLQYDFVAFVYYRVLPLKSPFLCAKL